MVDNIMRIILDFKEIRGLKSPGDFSLFPPQSPLATENYCHSVLVNLSQPLLPKFKPVLTPSE